MEKSILVQLQEILDKLSPVTLVQKVFLTQNLKLMLKSGISLSRALDALAQEATTNKLKNILLDIKIDVEKGGALSNSLKKYPKVFSEIFVNMVKAGEESGKLEEVLESLTIQMKKDHALISKVKGALTYPLVILAAMVAIGSAMMILVVPKITQVLTEARVKLPLPTKILIGFNKILVTKGVFVVLALIILTVLFIKFAKSGAGKKILHKLFLKLPIISMFSKKINLTRFARALSSLLQTDIPIVQSFELVSSLLGNLYYKKALRETSEKLAHGTTIASNLKEYPSLFPPIITQMISVGEEVGRTDEILKEIAEFYEEEMDNMLRNLPSLIEPILILFLGAGVALLAVSILLPLYSLSKIR